MREARQRPGAEGIRAGSDVGQSRANHIIRRGYIEMTRLFRRLDVEGAPFNAAADKDLALARVIGRARHAFALHLLDQRDAALSWPTERRRWM